MQEEWHRDERKCTVIILGRDLLLLDLDIVNDDQPSVAVSLPSHILWLLRRRRAVNHSPPCAVHRRCRVASSIAVAVAPSIAVAGMPSIAVVAVVSPLCHPLSSPHAFHRRRHRCVAVALSIAAHRCRCCVAVAPTRRPRHRCCHCCYHRHHHCPLLLIPTLVGCCVVGFRPILSSHAVMQPSTLSLPAAYTNNCLPPPPCRHRSHRRCRRATTTATATTVVELTVVH
jgi:hypothetical protein